ncbi:unnamed protein product [Gordionus sp. m RMFG-2023]
MLGSEIRRRDMPRHHFQNVNYDFHHSDSPNFHSYSDYQEPIDPPIVKKIQYILDSPSNKALIIMRGLPGSGKSYLSKLIKDIISKVNKADMLRILSLDDYFIDEDNKYNFEADMESQYVQSLTKSIKKLMASGTHNFIVMDSVNRKLGDLGDLSHFASQLGFHVYICELEADIKQCFERNIHSRTFDEIKKLVNYWETCPNNYVRLDVDSILHYKYLDLDKNENDKNFLQNESTTNLLKTDENTIKAINDDHFFIPSRWDNMETKETNLDKLDGLRKSKRNDHVNKINSIEEYLRLSPDTDKSDINSNSCKKRVRWADIEEAKDQAKKRAIGFVVGKTDWESMVENDQPHKALNKTKYI